MTAKNVQKSVMHCKIVVLLIKLIAFVAFPLPSPSSDLKVPNGSLFTVEMSDNSSITIMFL